jgi:hypothetical protein
LQHLTGTFLYSLPVSTGYIHVCDLHVLPFYGPATPARYMCAANQGGWSLIYMSLLLISMAMAIVPLWQLLKSYWFRHEIWSEEQRQAAVIHFTRLMLLGGGLLTIFLFLISPLAALKPTNTRYLVGLLIIVPGIIWPLWYSVSQHKDAATTMLRSLWKVSNYALLILIVIAYIGGTIATLQEIPASQATYQNDMLLIHDLEHRGITRFYSEYWTCFRLAFESDEKVICSIVDITFKQGGANRVASYIPIVKADRQAPYILPKGLYSVVAQRDPEFAKHYRMFELDGYVVYEPT